MGYRGSYLSRQRARGVSEHTVKRLPTPTHADLDATVYWQRWHAPGSPASVEFSVLAFDRAEADALGRLRLEHLDWRDEGVELEACTPALDADVERIAGILEAETAAEWQLRQTTHATRRRGLATP